jgi:hypothetical protein
MTSAKLRVPFGATFGSLRAAERKISVPINAEAIAIRPTLFKPGTTSRQRNNSLIGGNSNDKMLLMIIV